MPKIDLSRIVTAEMRRAEADAEDLRRRQAEARAYLAATDWLVVRQAETGVGIPDDIADARAAARGVLEG